MNKRYSIQEVARMLGMSKDTLRYYDKIGLVKPVREDNRYRMYTPDELIDLMNIQIMQYAGFTLERPAYAGCCVVHPELVKRGAPLFLLVCTMLL